MSDSHIKPVVLIRGAGEMASGIAYLLYFNNFSVCLTEISEPLAVSRANSFSDAVFEEIKSVGDVTAEKVSMNLNEIESTWEKKNIPLIVDPEAEVKRLLNPDILIDAIMAKKATGTNIDDAPLVIGIGPGFYAGRDVHIVVETGESGENTDRLIYKGEAEKDTGIPVEVGGIKSERVIWSPQSGIFTTKTQIGDTVDIDTIIGFVDDAPLKAQISGILRDFIQIGTFVTPGTKLIEIDPVYEKDVFGLIRDKIWMVARAVLKTTESRKNDTEKI